MDSRTLQADTKNLAKLFDPKAEMTTIYAGADLSIILRHQLESPLADELSQPICGAEGRSDPLIHLDESLKTFADLFFHSDPPIDLLKRTKDFAKSCRVYPELLPPEVATVLYFAAIAVAHQKYGEMITELDSSAYQQGLQWAASQPWMDNRLMIVFQAELAKNAGI